MNPILKNVLAVVLGVIAGAAINMGLIMLGGALVPPPEGVNAMDPASISSNIHLYEFKHFVFPWLAHAIGTLVGAFIAAKMAATHKVRMALIIGFFFLLGGYMAVNQISAPASFVAGDLLLAYLPMAWLGGRLGSKSN